MDSGNEVEDDVSPSSTPYLLYHISVDSSLGHQEAIDLISFLAIACDLGVPLLPMTWQAARERLGLGGSGDVRQALVDVQTSLAFKLVKDEDKAQREVELVLRIFANELIALSRPNLRAHPHIVDLLGICWDNPSTGGVWPALLFEKSQYSDLYNFSTLLVWRELAAMERLDLCLQIGSAIAEMHDQDIIHGDIKPQNVLVFKLDGRYVTKVTDFGYSSWFRDDTDRIRLPRSRPWHAPEGDRLSRNFSFAEAKRADIFSYALLCFWILFEKDLSSKAGAYLAEENLRPTSKGGGQQVPHSIRALGRLKQTDLLIDAVPQLLTEELGASGHAETLLEFFRSALIFDPDQRMESLCTFEILQSYRKDLGQVAIKSDYVNAITQLHGTNRFELANNLGQLYDLDPRVRFSIFECLERRVLRENGNSELSNDRIQLCLCYYMGFGKPRDEQKMLGLCSSESDIALVRAAIQSLKSRTSPSTHLPELVQQIYNQGHMGNLSTVDVEGDIQLFRQLEHTLRRELDDMTKSLNDPVCRFKIVFQLLAFLRRQGKFDEAEAIQVSVFRLNEMAFGEDHPNTVACMSNLAGIWLEKGNFHNALTVQRGVVSIMSRTLGLEHVMTLDAKQNLAVILFQLGQFEEAEKLEHELRSTRSKHLGADHLDTLTSMANLATIFLRQGRLEEAETLGKEVVEMRNRVRGSHHLDTFIAMSNLGLVYQESGQFNSAEDIQSLVLQRSRAVLGGMHPATLKNMSNLALTYWHQNKLLEAEELGLKTIEGRRQVLGAEHPDTLTSVANLALVYRDLGRPNEAISLEEDVLDQSRKTLGNGHPDTLLSMTNLAIGYEAANAWEKAEQLLEEAYETSKRIYGEEDTRRMESLGNLAAIYAKQRKIGKLEMLGI